MVLNIGYRLMRKRKTRLPQLGAEISQIEVLFHLLEVQRFGAGIVGATQIVLVFYVIMLKMEIGSSKWLLLYFPVGLSDASFKIPSEFSFAISGNKQLFSFKRHLLHSGCDDEFLQ